MVDDYFDYLSQNENHSKFNVFKDENFTFIAFEDIINLPHLINGTAGLLYIINKINTSNYKNSIYINRKFINRLIENLNFHVTTNPSFFDGLGGIIYILLKFNINKLSINKKIETLLNYKVEIKNKSYYPKINFEDIENWDDVSNEVLSIFDLYLDWCEQQ
ncbi:lanthionine synthetase LanC family protein [Staphylococcus petrasii]|uniref:lanthionine synthetase LanC family protein n=2 Tax=Staphylococcus petrasii TaxID=1276936 RepID=UPI000E069FF1|nr:lanthionine synthetase LanC family protein [Staphylococcus petrasii]TGA82866.1 hypothetical protein E2554_04715 [Staphylococcus petrasii]SUM59942.1 Uncharacterised protein [Staphylococcus petrasii]